VTTAAVELPGAVVAVPDRTLDLADPTFWPAAAALVGVGNLAVMTAAHGSATHTVTQPGAQPSADILVTTKRDLGLAALAADCVPIALAAPGAIAVVHAGWRGVLVGAAAVGRAALADIDAGPVTAVVGPAICGDCYQVPAERVDLFRDGQPAAVRDATHLDLTAAVVAQLAGCQVTVLPGCTAERTDLCSFRGGDQTRRGGILIARSAA
jgi:copper oxidase (laccase) domain-containing protein